MMFDRDSTIYILVRKEGIMAPRVVMSLLEGLYRKGHVVVSNNYFSNVGLFIELVSLETYARCTMWTN